MAEYSAQPKFQRGTMAPTDDLSDNFGMARRKGPYRTGGRPAPRARGVRLRLAQWRKFRDWTQEELASKAGVAVGTVSGLESGTVGYSDESLGKLAQAIGCSIGELFDVSPGAEDSIWPLWERAREDQRRALVSIAKSLIDPPK